MPAFAGRDTSTEYTLYLGKGVENQECRQLTRLTTPTGHVPCHGQRHQGKFYLRDKGGVTSSATMTTNQASRR
jgi:hypothetical protein